MKIILRPFVFVVSMLLLFSLSNCSKSKCKAVLISNCVSTKEYDPVCGCDGKTYGNPSEAACSSITAYTTGTCK